MEVKQMNVLDLGTITLSERIVADDPCYDRTVFFMPDSISAKPGEYKVFVTRKDEGGCGVCTASIVIIHTGLIDEIKLDSAEWEFIRDLEGCSGQCGIFDNTIYPKIEEDFGDCSDPESFFGECCKITSGETECGILKNQKGIVTTSGYCYGTYDLYSIKCSGENVAFMIDYNLGNMKDIFTSIIESQM